MQKRGPVVSVNREIITVAMRVYTVVLVTTILLSLAASGTAFLGRCTTNFACPSGSECADGYCAVCATDLAKCLRSVERCKALNCASDEGCYIREQQSGSSVVLSLVCAKINPCAQVTCQSGRCYVLNIGLQPPAAQCRPLFPPDACNGLNCPSGSRCLTRAGLCGGYACLLEGICVPSSDCVFCNFFTQFCEITVQNNAVKGTCSSLWGTPFCHHNYK